MALNPVSFKYNNDYLGGFVDDPNWTHAFVGFIAEEVDQIDPRLVSTDPDGTPNNVLYPNITAILAKAVQKQQSDISSLNASFKSSQSDLAEIYDSTENLEPGDVVSSAGNTYIEKSTSDNEEFMMGVVSTAPGIVLGLDANESLYTPNKFPVALSGRVPVKVTAENGAIQAGDYLTLSSVPGVAAKALKAGVVIGQALDSYSGDGVGKIDVFVKNSYYSGLPIDKLPGLATFGSLPESKDILAALLSGNLTTTSGSSHLTADVLVAGLEIVTPKLTAHIVEADEIRSPTIDALVARISNLENSSSTTDLAGAISNIKEWVVDKVTASLGIFNRVETKVANVSQGLELIDSATGNTYCLTIKNGEWDKTLGACGTNLSSSDTNTENSSDQTSTSTSTDIEVTTPDNTTTTDTSTETQSSSTDEVAPDTQVTP